MSETEKTGTGCFMVGGDLAEQWPVPSSLTNCIFHFRGGDDPPVFIDRDGGTFTVNMDRYVVIPIEQMLDGNARGKLVRRLRRAEKSIK